MIHIKSTVQVCFLLLIFIPSLIFSGTALDVSQFPNSATFIRHARIGGFTQQPFVIFENPASLSELSKPGMSLFSARIVDNESHLYSFALHYPLFNGHLGFGYLQHGVNDIPRTSSTYSVDLPGDYSNPNKEFPAADYYFNYKDDVVKLGYSFPINDKIHLGSTASYFRYQMDSVRGHAYNLDLGLFARPSRFIDLSLYAKNIVPFLKMEYNNNVSYRLPQEVKLSVKHQASHFSLLSQLSAMASQNKNNANVIYFYPAFAIESAIISYNFAQFNLSGGYSQYIDNASRFDLFSIGFNLDLNIVNFDFAYEKSDYIQNPSQFYFSISFENIYYRPKQQSTPIPPAVVMPSTPPLDSLALDVHQKTLKIPSTPYAAAAPIVKKSAPKIQPVAIIAISKPKKKKQPVVLPPSLSVQRLAQPTLPLPSAPVASSEKLPHEKHLFLDSIALEDDQLRCDTFKVEVACLDNQVHGYHCNNH